MSAKMTGFIRDLIMEHQGATALIGAFLLGITVATAGMGFTSRVGTLETKAVTAQRERHDLMLHMAHVDTIVERLTFDVCLLTKIHTGETVLGCPIVVTSPQK